MLEWIKGLLSKKITINIVYSTDPAVHHTTEPRIVKTNLVRKVRKSNLRFAEDHKVEYNGNERSLYYTEEYRDGHWGFVSGSASSNKAKAMELHVELLDKGSLETQETKIIHWEGLDPDETRQWVALNK